MDAEVWPRTAAVLRNFDVDPNLFMEDSVSDLGFRLRVGSGVRVSHSFFPWQTSLRKERVLQAMVEDRGAFHANNPMRVISTEPNGYKVNHVVLLRRMYDMILDDESAKTWIDAENDLSPIEYDAYQELYSQVSGNMNTNSTATRER